jgi:hypothetical protein
VLVVVVVAGLAIVAAVMVVALPRRYTAAIAFAVAAGGLAALMSPKTA